VVNFKKYLTEREYNKTITRNVKDVKIDYESSDTGDLEQWAWDGNEGYSEVAGDIYYVKDKKIYYVKNLTAEYDFKSGSYNIYSNKDNERIPPDIVKKLKKSKFKKNGKPIIFYHGTDANFKKFNNDSEGQNFSMGNFWKGMYFTDTVAYADSFGSIVKKVVINSKKPYYPGNSKSSEIEEAWHLSKYNKFEDYLMSQGFDSIVHMSTKKSQMTEVIVFDPKLVHIINQG